MRLKYFLIGCLLIAFAACKDGSGTITPTPPVTGGDTTGQNGDKGPEIALERAIFTNPAKVRAHLSSRIILDTLVKYLDHTPKEAVVHINIYLFNDEDLLNAVKSAYQRGVEMHVMIDHSRSESIESNKETIPQLQALLDAPSELVVVESDASATSIDHHKHVLFSEVDLDQGVAKNVVFSTSHNFISGGAEKVQDAVIFTNKKVYDAFLDNWRDMAGRSRSGMKGFTYATYQFDSIGIYFFPRRKSGAWDGHDTILDILNKISDVSTADILVGMSDWTTGRLAIAQKLTALQSAGATVEVIAKDKADADVLTELGKMKNKGGYLKVLKMPENIHSKFVLVKGTWDGKPQTILLCGTHNFTANALKNNNELLLMFKNSILFDQYYRYFSELKATL